MQLRPHAKELSRQKAVSNEPLRKVLLGMNYLSWMDVEKMIQTSLSYCDYNVIFSLSFSEVCTEITALRCRFKLGG